MTSRRRSYSTSRSSSRSSSPSPSPSRSSSAGPRTRRRRPSTTQRPSIKHAAILVAAVAVVGLCVHRLWRRRHPKRVEHWDLAPPGRHCRRRNVIRDRHNGYIDDYPRRLYEEGYYRSRGRGYENDAASYYDRYPPSPSERTRFSGRERIEERRRGLADDYYNSFDTGRDEVVRYDKASTARSEADTDRRSRRYEDVVNDWGTRNEQRAPSPTKERKAESVFDDRKSRSRRRSDY